MEYAGPALIVVGLIIMLGCMFVYFTDIGEDDDEN
jgi:hypothetical protein